MGDTGKQDLINQYEKLLQRLFSLREVNQSDFYVKDSILLLNFLNDYQKDFSDNFTPLLDLTTNFAGRGMSPSEEDYVDFTDIFCKILYDSQQLLMERLEDFLTLDQEDPEDGTRLYPILQMPLIKKEYFYRFMKSFMGTIQHHTFQINFLPEFIPAMIDEKIIDIDNHYSRLITDIDKKIKLLDTSSNEQISIIQNRIDSAESRLEKDTITSITALSIFTGILMTFVGGFQWASKSLSGITEQNDFKLFFLVSLLGFVIFNILVLFVHLLLKIHSSIKFGKGLLAGIIVTEGILIIALFVFGALYIGSYI